MRVVVVNQNQNQGQHKQKPDKQLKLRTQNAAANQNQSQGQHKQKLHQQLMKHAALVVNLNQKMANVAAAVSQNLKRKKEYDALSAMHLKK